MSAYPWIKVQADLSTGITEREDVHNLAINLTHIKKITPGQNGNKGCKVTFADGEVLKLKESFDYVTGQIEGLVERGFKLDPPKDA